MKKPLKHILILILLVSSLVGGFYWWRAMQPKTKSQTSNTTPDVSRPTTSPQIQFDLAKIDAIYASPHKSTKSATNLAKVAEQLGLEVKCQESSINGVLLDKFHDLGVTYRHPDLNYGVRIDSDCVIMKRNQTALEQDWQQWQAVYRNLNYQIVETSDKQVIFDGYGSRCLIDKGVHSNSLASVCVDKDYLAAAVKTLQALDQLVHGNQARPEKALYYVIDAQTKIRPAKDSQYQVLNLITSDQHAKEEKLAQFYQTPDYKWHLLAVHQGPLNCQVFNSSELKNIYEGTSCLDGQGRFSQVTK